MPDNIFDLTDCSDLPKELNDVVNRTAGRKIRQQYLDLFVEAGRPLTATEIRVAYYRRYKKVLKANTISTMLWFLKKENLLQRKHPRQWELT